MHPFETPETSPTRFSSPRRSIDLTNPPHSPFLHNLTQRLRKGSNASSQNGGLEGGPTAATQPAVTTSSPSPADPIKKTEKTKEVKKLLAAMVRDDWEYPSTVVRAKEKPNDGGIPYREPLGYRVREEWSSDIEAEERKAAYAYASANSGSNARTNTHGHGRNQNSPYKFESPDAVGEMVLERKRKRRRLVEEELSVNEGLRVWTNRRDAWTGAVKQRPKEAVAATKRKESGFENRSRPSHAIFRRSSSMLSHCHGHGHGHGQQHGRNASTSTSSSSPLNPGSTSGTKSTTINGDGTNITNTNASVGANTGTAIEASSVESDIVPDDTTTTDDAFVESSDSIDGPWLPIFPPLLPLSDGNHQQDVHVLRDRITPKAYSTIYSKVVVQGLAPNVPIPLVHMIPALVEGWKSEGNWPPQPTSISVADLKRGRRSSAFAKWRREHQHHNHHTIDTRSADGQITQHEREDGKGRVRRSISMMKRVLGGTDNVRGGGGGAAGLEELGIEFRDDDDDHERDNEEEMRKNVALNKALLG